MKVILNADVPHLGEEGDIKEVKSGYARNFLIPRKLGMAYNNASLAIIESRREAIEKRREEKRTAALSLKEKLEANPLNISMTTGRNGKLFGSVNSATIVSELHKQGIEVERKAIEIPENSIKTVGNFKVSVKLYAGETAMLTVAVSSSEVVAEKDKPAAPAATAEESATSEESASAEESAAEAADEATAEAAADETAENENDTTEALEESDQDSEDDE